MRIAGLDRGFILSYSCPYFTGNKTLTAATQVITSWRCSPDPNPLYTQSRTRAVQRTGASRFTQSPIQRHRRLAPVADLCVRQVPAYERQNQDSRWRHHAHRGERWRRSSLHSKHGVTARRVRPACDGRATGGRLGWHSVTTPWKSGNDQFQAFLWLSASWPGLGAGRGEREVRVMTIVPRSLHTNCRSPFRVLTCRFIGRRIRCHRSLPAVVGELRQRSHS